MTSARADSLPKIYFIENHLAERTAFRRFFWGELSAPYMTSREYPAQPLIGVGALIISEERIVIVKRRHEPLKGEWSIPGGVLALGETLRSGAEREALEETGLVVQAGGVVEVVDRIVSDAEGKTRYHYVLIDFLCRPVGGELRAAGDAEEARWVSREELAGFAIAEPALSVIAKAFDIARE